MARAAKRKSDANESKDPNGVVESLKAKRTNNSTKRTHNSKMSVMAKWLTKNYPDAVDSTSKAVLMPASREAILAFFHLCSAADTCDKRIIHVDDAAVAPMSVSSVERYRSALVDQYRSQLLTLDPLLDMERSHVLEGYEKQINNLKKRGLMKVNEGKHHLKSSGYMMLATRLLKARPEKKASHGRLSSLCGAISC